MICSDAWAQQFYREVASKETAVIGGLTSYSHVCVGMTSAPLMNEKCGGEGAGRYRREKPIALVHGPDIPLGPDLLVEIAKWRASEKRYRDARTEERGLQGGGCVTKGP